MSSPGDNFIFYRKAKLQYIVTSRGSVRPPARSCVYQLLDQSGPGLVGIRFHVDSRYLLIFIVLSEMNRLRPRIRTSLGHFDVSTNK
jgi:hypothetical protein